MSSLSDFLNSINQTKENLLNKDNTAEKEYVPFVINRCLSYFPDTVLHANRMNRLAFLDKKLQYDYYLHSITKRKRFSKWMKPEEDKNIEVVKEIYGYSSYKAKDVIDLVPMDTLRDLTIKGGQKK